MDTNSNKINSDTNKTNKKEEKTTNDNKKEENTVINIIKEIYNKKELEYKDYFLFLI